MVMKKLLLGVHFSQWIKNGTAVFKLIAYEGGVE